MITRFQEPPLAGILVGHEEIVAIVGLKTKTDKDGKAVVQISRVRELAQEAGLQIH